MQKRKTDALSGGAKPQPEEPEEPEQPEEPPRKKASKREAKAREVKASDAAHATGHDKALRETLGKRVVQLRNLAAATAKPAMQAKLMEFAF